MTTRIYTDYQVVTTLKALRLALRRAPTTIALDLETTSLSPAEGRVRTINICGHLAAQRIVVDCDRIKGGFKRCAQLITQSGFQCIVFYAGFEYGWFEAAGHIPKLFDVGNMRRAVIGGGQFSLKLMAQWDLEIGMDKSEQTSDWNASILTKKQLDYAFDDAAITWALYEHWCARMDGDHVFGAKMFDDLVPAVHEMQQNGILLNVKAHTKLTKAWEKEAAQLHVKLRQMVPETDVGKLTSNSQMSDYFARTLPDKWLAAWPRTEKTGQLSMTGKTMELMAGQCGGTPLAAFLTTMSDFQTVRKYHNSFGETLINAAGVGDGRIRARYNIGAAKTGRFSSSGPNIQQIPRGMHVRESFVAPRGRRLVSLDYSGIELRVLALLSGDKGLLHDVTYEDLHLQVASDIAGRKLTKKHQKARSAAKATSFLIVYGGTASGLSARLGVSYEKAQEMIEKWIERYPRAFEYRERVFVEAVGYQGYVRTPVGGTIWLSRKPEMPKCANYPVQRAALEVMAKAIIRHKASLDALRKRSTRFDALMLATIHDALIDEVKTENAGLCLRMMETDMTAGFLDVFPQVGVDNLVEGGIGTSWGKLK